MKKSLHRFMVLVGINIFLVCCSEPEKALPRQWSNSDKNDTTKKDDGSTLDPDTDESVPFIAQDGTQIISRSSLGFKRSDEKRQSKYEMQVTTIKDELDTEVASAKYFMSKLDRNAENCIVEMRKDLEFVFYDLDCIRTPNNSQSRYFDLGFTQDDLLLFSTSDCVFEDLGQVEKNDYADSRYFSIECTRHAEGLLVARYLKVESWFHPSSPHPSGLVELTSSVCAKKPCSVSKVYKINKIEDDWKFTDPGGYDRVRCSFKADLYRRAIRCGDETCFDSTLIGFKSTSICKCTAKISNIPVKYIYLGASSLSEESVVANEFFTEQECADAVSADTSCQECFSSDYLNP